MSLLTRCTGCLSVCCLSRWHCYYITWREQNSRPLTSTQVSISLYWFIMGRMVSMLLCSTRSDLFPTRIKGTLDTPNTHTHTHATVLITENLTAWTQTCILLKRFLFFSHVSVFFLPWQAVTHFTEKISQYKRGDWGWMCSCEMLLFHCWSRQTETHLWDIFQYVTISHHFKHL